jgi:hypothetical protein
MVFIGERRPPDSNGKETKISVKICRAEENSGMSLRGQASG